VYDDAAAHVMIAKLYEGLQNPHTHHESCYKPCDRWQNASGQNTSHSVARIEHPLVVAVPLCVHVCHGIGPGIHLSWYCCKGTCPCGFPLMAAAVTVTECGLVCTPRNLFFLCKRHTILLMWCTTKAENFLLMMWCTTKADSCKFSTNVMWCTTKAES
jgi:hypothetical protein